MDSVVTSAKVSSGVNEVDVEVVVIILFKLDGVEVLAGDTNVGNLKLRKKVFKDGLIFRSDLFRGSGLLSSSLTWELNLDSLGLEWLSSSCSCDIRNLVKVSALSDAEVVGNQVCCCSHEVDMELVLWVKPLGFRGTLGSRPEGVSVRIKMILGEYMKEIEDLVIEELLEVLAGNIYAGLKLG